MQLLAANFRRISQVDRTAQFLTSTAGSQQQFAAAPGQGYTNYAAAELSTCALERRRKQADFSAEFPGISSSSKSSSAKSCPKNTITQVIHRTKMNPHDAVPPADEQAIAVINELSLQLRYQFPQTASKFDTKYCVWKNTWFTDKSKQTIKSHK